MTLRKTGCKTHFRLPAAQEEAKQSIVPSKLKEMMDSEIGILLLHFLDIHVLAM